MKLKYLFLFLISIGLSFGSVVLAADTGSDCEEVISAAIIRGEKVENVAVFHVANSMGTDLDQNPDSYDKFCVISKLKGYATFSEMVKYAIFYSTQKNDVVVAEVYNPNSLEFGWSNQEGADSGKNASDVKYLFNRDYKTNVGNSADPKNPLFVDLRLRYDIGTKYYYFMEMYEFDINILKKNLSHKCSDFGGKELECKKLAGQCFWLSRGSGECWSKFDTGLCKDLTKYPALCDIGNANGSSVCEIVDKKCVPKGGTAGAPDLPSGFKYEVPKGYEARGGVIPACAFTVKGCEDVNDLLQLVVNVGKTMFGAIAVFAFLFFIYGGVTFLTSFGSAERVKKGRDILVASVLGLIVAFSAYMIIYLLLDFVGVKDVFSGIK